QSIAPFLLSPTACRRDATDALTAYGGRIARRERGRQAYRRPAWPSAATVRRPGRSLLRVLVAELLEVLPGDVHPLLLGSDGGRDPNVAVPLRDRFAGVGLLVGHGEVVVRRGVLRVDLDHLLVLDDGVLVEALLLVDLAEPHPRLEEVLVEIDRLLVGAHRLVVEPLLGV